MKSFSLWCDFIERDFLEGGFKELIDNSVINGATSNPSIFAQSFMSSPAYKAQINELKGKTPKNIYEALALKDIKRAAELLLPLYQAGNDGFISIEIDPFLCDDIMQSIDEGKRLFKSLNMPNIMIKVPATSAGYSVMSELVAGGINVNATLIFSPEQALSTLKALRDGYKDCQTKAPATVLSVFVSRFDRKCDKMLSENGFEKGRLGILNATYIYNFIKHEALPNTRCLFASTGVKGDEYKKSYYIDELLFENCVNTAPLETIKAYLSDGSKEFKAPTSQESITKYFEELTSKNINLAGVYHELIDEGIKAFHASFEELLTSLKG